MTLKDQIAVLTNPDRVRIMKENKEIFVGYRASLVEDYGTHIDEAMTENENAEVKKLRVVPEISHKKWKEKGLIPPTQPELLAQYSFSDLQMSLYYTIYI